MSTILNATRKIVSLTAADPKSSSLPILIDFVSRFGALNDAELLYECFEATKDPDLLDPIMLHGNDKIAYQLFKKAIVGGKLNPAYPSEILVALAYLQVPEVEEILMRHYQEILADNKDWDFHINVCLGLLNYSCNAYEQEIRQVIEQCLAVHLFPDLLPIIAYKLNDEKLNNRLIQHAEEVASTSCISGILFSTAMAGKAYRERFKSMVLDKSLEATYSGIGNTYFTCMGMHALQITIAELYEDFLTILKQKGDDVEDQLNILYDLLQAKLSEPIHYGVKGLAKVDETIASLNSLFFAWKENPNKDETIFGLINEASSYHEFSNDPDWHKDRWYSLQDQYQWKLANEVILDLVEITNRHHA